MKSSSSPCRCSLTLPSVVFTNSREHSLMFEMTSYLPAGRAPSSTPSLEKASFPPEAHEKHATFPFLGSHQVNVGPFSTLNRPGDPRRNGTMTLACEPALLALTKHLRRSKGRLGGLVFPRGQPKAAWHYCFWAPGGIKHHDRGTGERRDTYQATYLRATEK